MAVQLAGFQFAKPFDVTNPVSTDKRYGKYNGTTTVPFASIAEAIDLIKFELRYQGLQCVIENGLGSINLFWWRDGTANNQLVLLQTDVDLSSYATKQYVDDNKLGKTDTYNALDYTDQGKVLDARQGKSLSNLIASKQNIEQGKGLVPTADITKLAAITRDFGWSFTFPVREAKDLFRTTETITDITLDGVSSFSYSINGGTSYITPVLPLTLSTQITIAAGTVVRWRIAFANNITIAMVNIKLK